MENKNKEQLDKAATFNSEQKCGAENTAVENVEVPGRTSTATRIPTTNRQGVSASEMISIQKLFEKSWGIFVFNFWKFMGLMLLPLAGGIVLSMIIGLFTVFGFGFGLGGGFSMLMGLVFGILALISFLLMVGLALIAQASMLVLVRDSSKNLGFIELLKAGMGYAVSLFWVKLLVGILVMVGAIFFIVPGVALAGFYSMAAWVLFYEGKKGLSALSRSMALIKGYWWAVFLRLLSVWGGYYLIVVISSFVGHDFSSLVSTLLVFVVAPFFLVYSCFVYWDLVRIKGNDAA